MYRDVLGAAIFARDVLGWSRVACIGVSNGAAVSLLAAALDDGITYSTRTGEQGDASTGEKAGQGAHRPDPAGPGRMGSSCGAGCLWCAPDLRP